MECSDRLQRFLHDLMEDNSAFEDADFTDISWCNHEGENALHMAVCQQEYAVAEELIALGIDLNARGDLGRTPLHEAAALGALALVELLVESGADVFALTEGYPPFTLARFADQDEICRYLGAAMTKQQDADAAVWARAQIAYLRREIARLERRYGLQGQEVSSVR